MTSDADYMARALAVAERGRGTTSPNPIVGALIVDDEGVVVGRGAHLVAGGPHAEVLALADAGERARGATLYCTLEPCSHTGRTGPCAPKVVAAGIRRAVIAMGDPNPLVSGRGIELLRSRRRGGDGRHPGSGRAPTERAIPDENRPRAASRHDESGAQRRRQGGARRWPLHASDGGCGEPPYSSRSRRGRRDCYRIRHAAERRPAADGAYRLPPPAVRPGDLRPATAEHLRQRAFCRRSNPGL